MAAAKKPKQPSINERLSASADGISTNLREENAKLRAEVARLKALLAKHGIASELNDAMPLLEAEANNPEEKKAPAKKAAKAKRKTEPLKAGESPIVEGSDLSELPQGPPPMTKLNQVKAALARAEANDRITRLMIANLQAGARLLEERRRQEAG